MVSTFLLSLNYSECLLDKPLKRVLWLIFIVLRLHNILLCCKMRLVYWLCVHITIIELGVTVAEDGDSNARIISTRSEIRGSVEESNVPHCWSGNRQRTYRAEGLWGLNVMEWRPYTGKRSIGRPLTYQMHWR